MGKLTRSAGRVLAAGILVLAVAGVLGLAGAGAANARPAVGGDACNPIFVVFNNIPKLHKGLKGDVAIEVAQFRLAESGTAPQVQSAVNTLIADLQADAAAGQVNRPKIVTDGDAIIAACAAHPNGAPATGGGSTAGVQDPVLFGVGGAAVLVGLGVLGLAGRNRLRTDASHT